MKIALILLLTTAAHAQYAGSASGSTTAAAEINGKASVNYAAGGGTAQAQTATFSPAPTSLVDGLPFCWLPAAANTGAAPTFSPNGLTAHPVVKIGGAALVANDIITTQHACVIYNLASTNWELQNPQVLPVAGWKSNVTNQSTSQSTVTLATAPTAGDYKLSYSIDLNTPCTTGSNSVSFAFSWTAASARTLSTGSFTMPAAQATTTFMNGVIPLHVTSGNVTYISTVAGTCASGTSSYNLNAWLERVN